MREPRYRAPSNEDIVDRQFLIKDKHGVVTGLDGQELVGAVLDAESETMQQFGKLALAAHAGAGIEQLLHLEIADMVKYTDKFRQNPYGRVAVSMDPILSVVYAENPYIAGDYVRMLHNKVNGVATDGRRIRALDPDAFYWAHDTFVGTVKKNWEHYTPHPERAKMTKEEIAEQQRQFNERVHLESNTWYSYYGMPMSMVPADYDAYVPWREDMINNRLEMNETAEWAIDAAVNRKPPKPDGVPASVWRLASVALAPVTEVMSLVTIGEISPDIRKRFGISFSTEEQKRLDELRTIAKAFVHPLPDPVTYLPVYDSLLRDRGGHKNNLDKFIYRAMSMGKTSVQAVAGPVLKRVA